MSKGPEPADEEDGFFLSASALRMLRSWNFLWITGALLVGIILIRIALMDSVRHYSPYDNDVVLCPTDTFLVGDIDNRDSLSKEEIEQNCVTLLCGCLLLGLAVYGIALVRNYKVTLRWLVAGVLFAGTITSVPMLLQENPKGLRTRMVVVPNGSIAEGRRQAVLEALGEDAARKSLGEFAQRLHLDGKEFFTYLHVRAVEPVGPGGVKRAWSI